MSTGENVSAIGDRIRELLALIAKLRDLFPAISLEDIIAIFSALAKLLPLPDLADEAGCRQWCRALVGVLNQIADLTTTTLDDSAVAVIGNVVEDDTLWGLLWDLVSWLTSGAVADDAVTEAKARALGEKVGIDPFTIIAIIQAVIQFINWWRNR